MSGEPTVTVTVSDWPARPGQKWYQRDERLIENGIEYKRWSYSGGQPPESCDGHFMAKHGAEPGVLCGKCLGSTFTLIYGNYEISAKCKRCGHAGTVYDG